MPNCSCNSLKTFKTNPSVDSLTFTTGVPWSNALRVVPWGLTEVNCEAVDWMNQNWGKFRM